MKDVIVCNIIFVTNNKTETVFLVVNKRNDEPYKNCWEIPSGNFLFDMQPDTFSKKIITDKFNVPPNKIQTSESFLDLFDEKLYIIYRCNIEYNIAKEQNIKILPILQILNLNMAFNYKRYIRDLLGGF